MGLDIGPDAIESFSAALDSAKTIVWNGPMGVSEFDKFAAGTDAIGKKLAQRSSHVSTGGFASLQLLEGIPFTGMMVLDDDDDAPVEKV
ncbi:phosphoglycerate kinase, cytosolic [Nicotiana attenuata]|uniref:phosphoglycerate kinase n=1 Tax=Nicotiana attenuata TaxID=49451 RepID=A0A314L633_NICAT|nr:phosphoglycerate kinase, cytosolic [Nicotiana attenuata]